MTNNTLAEALERLGMIADGCAVTAVYGPEWTIFPDVEMRKDLRQALATLRASTDAAAVGEQWPLRARVWTRESTNEKVLEIEGTIGHTNMTCRHTQPIDTPDEDVPGLPTLYAHPPADAAAVAGEGKAAAFEWPSEEEFAAQTEQERIACLKRYYAHQKAISHPAPAEPVGLREAISILEEEAKSFPNTDWEMALNAAIILLREKSAPLTRTDEAQS